MKKIKKVLVIINVILLILLMLILIFNLIIIMYELGSENSYIDFELNFHSNLGQFEVMMSSQKILERAHDDEYEILDKRLQEKYKSIKDDDIYILEETADSLSSAKKIFSSYYANKSYSDEYDSNKVKKTDYCYYFKSEYDEYLIILKTDFLDGYCLKGFNKNSIKEFGDNVILLNFYGYIKNYNSESTYQRIDFIKSNVDETLTTYTYNVYYIEETLHNTSMFWGLDETYNYDLCKSSFTVDKITGKTDLKVDKDYIQYSDWMNKEVLKELDL